MDCGKPSSSDSTRSKFTKTLSKCLHPQTQTPVRLFPTQTHPNVHPHHPSKQLRTLSEELNMSIKDLRSNQPPKFTRQKSQRTNNSGEQQRIAKHKATKEALIAKLFASLSSIKASYAELQSAQFPYNNDAVHLADEAMVSELMVLSELKQKYFDNALDLPPPHVTQLLAEIQEQQSNIKTYEITMKQLEWKIQKKEMEISCLKIKLEEVIRRNKTLEKRFNSSGILCPLANSISLSHLNQTHFIRVLHHALKSLRHFVKHLVRDMEVKCWDLDIAVKSIEPNTIFHKPRHKIHAFESYATQIMFDGFNHPNYFLPNEENSTKQPPTQRYFETFKKLQSLTSRQIITQNPRSPFAQFCKGKYLKLVHPKMECSFFENLEQRKAISTGAFPGTEFFSLFAEMARRVWLLHCLAFSFEPPIVAFQVRRGSRFSEVYMESVTAGEGDVIGADVKVSFTVVPGFKIGKTVVQSQVYLSPKRNC